MKARLLAIFLILVGSALLNAPMARADLDPIFTLDNLFTALNTGEIDTALAEIAEGAIVENLVRDETYRGANEIKQMLQAMQREGRQYEIVRVEMTGETITVDVAISDHGQLWGKETIIAEVSEGKLQKLSVSAIKLKLW